MINQKSYTIRANPVKNSGFHPVFILFDASDDIILE